MIEKIIKPKKEFEKRRKREKFREKISEISFGVLNKLCDIALFLVVLNLESMKPRFMASTLAKDLGQFYPSIDIKSWLGGLRNIRKRRWVDSNGALTKNGKERLQNIFPKLYPKKKWDKNWYIVNFDIPETWHKKRDILREKLKKLGFGMLQQSVWISPVNFLGTIQEEVESLELVPFVLCSKTSELGEEDSRVLANRVWKIDQLNENYKRFVEKYEKGIKKEEFPKVFLDFMNILQVDPQLFLELLPDKWWGNDAYELLSDFYVNSGVKNKYTDYFFENQ